MHIQLNCKHSHSYTIVEKIWIGFLVLHTAFVTQRVDLNVHLCKYTKELKGQLETENLVDITALCPLMYCSRITVQFPFCHNQHTHSTYAQCMPALLSDVWAYRPGSSRTATAASRFVWQLFFPLALYLCFQPLGSKWWNTAKAAAYSEALL